MELILSCHNAEAALARQWPSRVKLKKGMKGEIQQRSLRLHLPYFGSGAAAGAPSNGAQADAGAAGAAVDYARPALALKRPLPFESRAALLQAPLRRPKASILADVQLL